MSHPLGQTGQALGRSRGGFGTKIPLKTDHDGFPIAFELTGGEAADSPVFKTPIYAGPDETPGAVVSDNGYDSEANRTMARERDAAPIIPKRSNIKTIPAHFANALYRGRTRIEHMMGKPRRFGRLALRCEKTERNVGSIASLAAPLILIKDVQTA
ncbi:MAG: transposase [Pseudomonadota bacterium]